MIQVGDSELLLDDSRRVHEIIVAAGGESTLEIWPHVFHCWQMLAGMVPESRAALAQSVEFMKQHVSTAADSHAQAAGGIPVPDANIQPDSTTPSIA